MMLRHKNSSNKFFQKRQNCIDSGKEKPPPNFYHLLMAFKYFGWA